jgi:hypothetical protein
MNTRESVRYKLIKFLDKHVGGHITFALFGLECTWYGHNAMHFAFNAKTRYGYICMQPPAWCDGIWWKPYLYLSPNATPGAATFAIGPGLTHSEKKLSHVFRAMFGHGYNTDEYRQPMNVLKGIYEQLEVHRIRALEIDKAGGVAEGELG